MSEISAGVPRGLQYLAKKGGPPAAGRTRLTQIQGYFKRHRDQIHYDQYLAAGYLITSGVIEGICRHVARFASSPEPETRSTGDADL